MNVDPKELLFLDFASYCVVGFFACLAFMVWYLRRNTEGEQNERVRNSVWLQNIFYFRDFTRKKFGSVHYVYHLCMVLLATVLAVFSLNIFIQFAAVEPPFRYLLTSAVVLIIFLLVGLVYRLSKKRYFE